jgi:ABC-type sulfate/molybdate transport systems ATPase subunit
MSDRVAVISNGQIEQIGSPVDVYERPAPSSSPGSSASPTFCSGTASDSSCDRRRSACSRRVSSRSPACGWNSARYKRLHRWASTRDVVRLDRGEHLVAVRQNMDATGDAKRFQGRSAWLAWTPDHMYLLKTKET